jgi:hypothetical protein
MAKRSIATDTLRYDLEGTLGDDLSFAVTWKDSSMLITKVSHGKDSSDINSLWTTTEGVVIVLSEIVDTNTLRFYRYEAIDPPVDISITGTITHTYGAVHTTSIVYTAAFFNLPKDFTGCTALGQIKVNQTDILETDFDIVLGKGVSNIAWSLPNVRCSALLPEIKYYYDIQITHPVNVVHTYIYGTLKLFQDTSF